MPSQPFEQPADPTRRALLGSAGSLALVLAMRRAWTAEAQQQASVDPRYALADRLCDLVIPSTDTPGGAAVHAATFVLLALDHHLNDLDSATFERVRAELQRVSGGKFLGSSAAQQSQWLAQFDARAFALRNPPDDSAEKAWLTLKPALVAGYYSTEAGASVELVYEPVPDSERKNFTLTSDYRARSNQGFGGSL